MGRQLEVSDSTKDSCGLVTPLQARLLLGTRGLRGVRKKSRKSPSAGRMGRTWWWPCPVSQSCFIAKFFGGQAWGDTRMAVNPARKGGARL